MILDCKFRKLLNLNFINNKLIILINCFWIDRKGWCCWLDGSLCVVLIFYVVLNKYIDFVYEFLNFKFII